MNWNLSTQRNFIVLCVVVTVLMVTLFFWRIHLADQQLHKNTDERVAAISMRIASTLIPLVINIYKKSTERAFTEETASAILDAEMQVDFIRGIKVYGNFGHIFTGKYKNQDDKLITTLDDFYFRTYDIVSARYPVRHQNMTIGNIEVYYTYKLTRDRFQSIVIQELIQFSLITLFVFVLLYITRKASIEKIRAEKSLAKLNATQTALHKSEKLLIEANNSLEEQVKNRTQELEEANKKLTKATADARQASQSKSLFLANMSHEIRTPMNGVIGLTDLLLRTDLSEQQRDYLTKLKFSSNNLLHLLNDILDFSKIEAGKLSVEFITFNFREMLDSIQQTFAAKAQEKNIELIINYPSSFTDYVVGDVVRCSQIISNLISNAIKFTDTGSVTVNVTRTDISDQIKISVLDTGIGISSEQQARLFAPFSQADDSTSRKYGGTGLGLVISKHLALLMGGDIHLSSELGRGTQFDVLLNLPEASKAEAEQLQTETTIGIDVHESKILKNKTLLLVEDIAINRLIAQEAFEQAGLIVHCAENGKIAVEMATAADYDLIVMDIQMPIMDGYEATRLIRKLPNHHHTPIIAMTANAMSDDKELSLASGMNSHLTKPIQIEQAVAELEKFISESNQSI